MAPQHGSALADQPHLTTPQGKVPPVASEVYDCSDALNPNPIFSSSPKPSKAIPLVISGCVYGLMAFGAIRAAQWVEEHRERVLPAVPPTAPLYILDLAAPPPQINSEPMAGGGGEADGQLFLPPQETRLDTVPDAALPPTEDLLSTPAQVPQGPAEIGSKPVGHHHGGGPVGGGGGVGVGLGTGHGAGAGPGIGGSPAILTIDDLDPESFEKPDYPVIAQKAGLEGAVMVRMRVSPDGVPLEARALNGNPIFYGETLKAVKRWKFASLRKRKITTPIEIDVRILFILMRQKGR